MKKLLIIVLLIIATVYVLESEGYYTMSRFTDDLSRWLQDFKDLFNAPDATQ